MRNESWRQCVQFKIAHTVRADNHRGLLFVEGIDNGLQCLRRGIEIVRIELNGKASTVLAIDGFVPASTNAKVGALRGDDVELVAVAQRHTG